MTLYNICMFVLTYILMCFKLPFIPIPSQNSIYDSKPVFQLPYACSKLQVTKFDNMIIYFLIKSNVR